jgi:hypothetical protein
MPDYDAQIPQPADILSDSQDDILQNFQQLNAAWNVNHVPFNSAAPTQGNHNQVTLPNIPNVTLAAPTPTVIGSANMWSAQSIYTMTTELQWQRENNGTTIEWTGSSTPTTTNSGWTRLPSGVLLKWGRGINIANGGAVVFAAGGGIPVFQPIAGPITVNPVNVQCTLISNVPALLNIAYGTSNTQFTVNILNTTNGAPYAGMITLSYLAIGF